jgi:hypothetical protein
VSKSRQAVVLIGLLAVAAGFHLWRLGAKPLWADEALSWWTAVIHGIQDVHPPLYPRLLELIIRFAGASEAALRFPSVLAAVATAAVLAWAAAELGLSPGARLSAAAWGAFSPYLLLVSQQARMYALSGLEGAVFVAALLAWRRRRRLWALATAAVAAVAGVYTLHTFWFLIAGGVFLWPWRERRALLITAGAYLLVVAAFVPFAPAAVAQFQGRAVYGMWDAGQLWAAARAAAGAPFYFGAGFRYHPLTASALGLLGPARLVGLLVAAGAALGPAVAALVAGRRGDRTPWLLAGAGATALAGNLAGASGAEQFSAAFPVYALLWVWGASRLATPWRFLAAAAWAATAGAAAAYYFRAPSYPLHAEDWRAAAAYIKAAADGRDEVVTVAGPGGPPALRYYGGLNAVNLGHGGVELRPDEVPPWLVRALAARRRIFLCYGDYGDARTFDALRRLGRERGVGIRRFGEGLVLFEYTGAGGAVKKYN